MEKSSLLEAFSETGAGKGRRPSFSHMVYQKAEEDGFNVVCPWENSIDAHSSQEDLKSEEDDAALELFMTDFPQRKFFPWRSSKRNRSGGSVMSGGGGGGGGGNEATGNEKAGTTSSLSKTDSQCTGGLNAEPDDTERELIAFQRELINLPNFSLGPSSQGDSRSASPSLLLSRSNSVPNLCKTGPPTPLIRQPSIGFAAPSETGCHLRDDLSLLNMTIGVSTSMQELVKPTFQFTVPSPQDSPEHQASWNNSLSSSIFNLSPDKPSGSDSAAEAVAAPLPPPTPVSHTLQRQNALQGATPSCGDRDSCLPPDGSSTCSRSDRPRSLVFLPPPAAEPEEEQQQQQPAVVQTSSPQAPSEFSRVHRAVMRVIETWMQGSIVDFYLMKEDVKEFLTRFAALGPDHRHWSQNIWSYIKTNVSFGGGSS